MSLRLLRVTISARLVAITLPTEPVAALPDGEVSRLPLRRLAFGPGKSGTNQWTMDGPLIVATRDDRFVDDDNGFGLFRGFDRFDRKHRLGLDHVDDRVLGNQNRGFCHVDRYWCCRRDRFLPSRRRYLGVLVLVLGVTRGAACLLHLVFDHRHYRMVCDATLARTVVV
jgi:hypothetical protein